MTKESSSEIFWDNLEICKWFGLTDGLNLSPRQINVNDQWILDIDLDAFARILSSHMAVEFLGADQSTGWEKRLDETVKILSRVKQKPSQITICRSQGEPAYVPHLLVNKIQDHAVEGLKRLYSTPDSYLWIRRFVR